MWPQALLFGVMYETMLLPTPTQNNTVTLLGSYSYLNWASGFAWPSTIDRTSQQLRWTAAVGEQRSVLSLSHLIYLLADQCDFTEMALEALSSAYADHLSASSPL